MDRPSHPQVSLCRANQATHDELMERMSLTRNPGMYYPCSSSCPHRVFSPYNPYILTMQPSTRKALYRKGALVLTENTTFPHSRRDKNLQSSACEDRANTRCTCTALYTKHKLSSRHQRTERNRDRQNTRTRRSNEQITATANRRTTSMRSDRSHCVELSDNDDESARIGPIRLVQDCTATMPAKYLMDPSYMDYQRKAEDMLAKFLHKLVKKASEMGLVIKYYKLYFEDGPFETTYDSNRAFESASVWDLRWQLNHLSHENKSLYCNRVFQPSPILDEFIELITKKVNDLAHKKYLKEGMAFKDTCKLLNKMVELADTIYNAVQHIEDIVPILETHLNDLKGIRDAFLKLQECKTKNETAFERLTAREKQQTAMKVLEKLIADHCSGDPEDAHRIVALQIAPCFGIALTTPEFS